MSYLLPHVHATLQGHITERVINAFVKDAKIELSDLYASIKYIEYMYLFVKGMNRTLSYRCMCVSYSEGHYVSTLKAICKDAIYSTLCLHGNFKNMYIHSRPLSNESC